MTQKSKGITKKTPPPKQEKPLTKIISTKQGLIEVEVKKDEKKKDTRKYIKVAENESQEKCKEIGERVYKKEIKFAYYASDGSMGYRYYVIL